MVAPHLTENAARRVIYDALDHKDLGDDNLIELSEMPSLIRDITAMEGMLYVYRNHLYENMVDEQQAIDEGRYNPDGHYHEMGNDTMMQALLALNEPSMVIADKMKAGNPAVTLVLPVFDKNDFPIHAVIGFYNNQGINGNYEKRPHIAVTFYGHEYDDDGGRQGIVSIVNDAIEEGKVLYVDEKMRADLPVIAKGAPLGNITVPTLRKSVAQFQKEVKAFKEKNDLIYFDHKLYSLGLSQDGSVGLYKITVEEYFQSRREQEIS